MKLHIKRDSGYADSLRKYTIIVDGENVDYIGTGQSRLPPTRLLLEAIFFRKDSGFGRESLSVRECSFGKTFPTIMRGLPPYIGLCLVATLFLVANNMVVN